MRSLGLLSFRVRKLAWGVRQVGVRRTLRGAARLARITVTKPESLSCSTPAGATFVLQYPSQLMPTLVLFGDLLEPELGLLGQRLGPGSIAVDVGSSIGTWAVSAARTGAVVHACEPDPENRRSLEVNVRDNDFPGEVIVHSTALGAVEGWATLVSNERRYLNQFQVDRTGQDQPVQVEEQQPGRLALSTLDAFTRDQGIDHIDVLKVNTAGGERDVVLGAMALLARGAVTLLMVLDGLQVRPLLDEVADLGYEMGIWDGEQHRIVPVPNSSALDSTPRSPMNRYVLLQRPAVAR
jgi:FkbM family methyltransferase